MQTGLPKSCRDTEILGGRSNGRDGGRDDDADRTVKKPYKRRDSQKDVCKREMLRF